jgi:DNA-binding MarR family transcriptional regulator
MTLLTSDHPSHQPPPSEQENPPASDTDAAYQAERVYSILFTLVLDLEKRLAAHLAAHGLTTPQFYVLKTLQEQGGSWSIGKIARAHGLTNAAMTGLISRMEAADPPLVARRTDDRDRRGVLVGLTQAGYTRYEAVQQALLDNLRAIFALLPADERAHLVDQLAHYVELFVRLPYPTEG